MKVDRQAAKTTSTDINFLVEDSKLDAKNISRQFTAMRKHKEMQRRRMAPPSKSLKPP